MAEQRRWSGHVWLVLAALAVAAIGLVVPSPVAAAEGDLATTTRVSATLQFNHRDPDRHLQATVTTSTGVQPTGVVAFSVDGVEVGRAVLQVGSSTSTALLITEVPVGPDRLVTAQYLGAPGFVASSGSTSISVPAHTPAAPGSGELRIGDAVVPIQPGAPFLVAKPSTNPITGLANAVFVQSRRSITQDVPGTGPVTVAFHLRGGFSMDLANDGSVGGTIQLSVDIRSVTVDGTTWAAPCTSFGGRPSLPLTGTVEGTTLHLDTSVDALAPTGSSDCQGFGDLVSAVLAKPATLEVDVEGTFPIPPPEGTPTTTTVLVQGTSWDSTSPLRISTRVDSAYGQVQLGTITLSVDGTPVVTYRVDATGPYHYVGPLEPGPVDVTATYGGASPFAGSSATTTITVDPPPDGVEVGGAFTVGANVAPLPPGSKLVGVAFDPATGAFSAASLWTPRGSIPVETGIIGRVNLLYRAGSSGPISGRVAPDGTVSFDPADLRLEFIGYLPVDSTQRPSALGNCILDPMTVTLAGTADVDGLTVGAQDAPRPPLPSGGCSGLASFISPILGPTFDVELTVAGDFRVGVEDTQLAVASLFPAVAQHNQTLLVATATAPTAPGGTVAFYDGDVLVAEAPLDASGRAVTAAALDRPGTRTIEARYLGDPTHRRATATTTLDVTPTPDGLAIEGTVGIGDVDLPIGTGSVLEPQDGVATGADPAGALAGAVEEAGAQLWFAPTTVELDLAGHGAVTAEVRLVQNGRLTRGAVQPDGSFSGLFGAFGLHVRSVTTADGTTVRPLGCINVVLLVLDGRLGITEARLDSAAGGSARYRNPACSGVGRAVADALADQAVDLEAIVDY